MFLTLNEKLQLFHCHQASISLPKQNFESASMTGLYGIWKLRYFRTSDLFFMQLLFSQATFNNQQPIDSKIYKRFSRVNTFTICSLDLTEKFTNNYLEKVLEAVKHSFWLDFFRNKVDFWSFVFRRILFHKKIYSQEAKYESQKISQKLFVLHFHFIVLF